MGTQTDQNSRSRALAAALLAAATALLLAAAPALENDDPLHYETATARDPIARLQQRIDRGQVKLSFDAKHGYLESVLRELKVPLQSQGLVFSKTSFQASRISPRAPRALYFNDDVYIGWVHGGDVLEAASVDPQLGPVFYLLPQRDTGRPRFRRENTSCLQCHQSPLTGNAPGLLMRSVYPDSEGMPLLTAGTYITTDQSPYNQRWGGWYMDGQLAKLNTMGGEIARDPDHPEQMSPLETELDRPFDPSAYLTPHSDAVALLVLAHQTHLHNLLTQANYQTRRAEQEEAVLGKVLGGKDAGDSEALTLRIKSACEPLVAAMLFSGEAPLPGPMDGSSGFREYFQNLGPRDHLGRSLRDFDLHRRLFRYPCSYLIYSEQFDSLPARAKAYIYRRLWQILTGRDDCTVFDHLSDNDRDAIYQIIRQTKNDLPSYWKPRSG